MDPTPTDTAVAPEHGQCGQHAHIWEWNSQAHPSCPLAQRCLCGGATYGAALQGIATREATP